MKSHSPRGARFWEQEYQGAQHLALSANPSSDLLEFMRWSDRQKDELDRVVDHPQVYDVGCGNGRNVHFLEQTSGARGGGCDISNEAITQAKKKAAHPHNFVVHDITKFPYPVDACSIDLALDMMSSHILNTSQRQQLREELDRIVRPGGFIFYKTFLLDGDVNAKAMIRKRPGKEQNSYVHHAIGHTEYVLGESTLIQEIEAQGWKIHKISKSHRHVLKGQTGKRRTISLYLQKPYDW